MKTYFLNSSTFQVLSEEILHAGAELRFRANGASMRPMIQDGDVLLVQPVDPGHIRMGDVVLCSCNKGFPLVHRVIRRQKAHQGFAFLVQGDQASQPDGWIPGARIAGRLASIERGEKTFVMENPGIRLLSLLAALRQHLWLSKHLKIYLPARIKRALPIFSEASVKRIDG